MELQTLLTCLATAQDRGYLTAEEARKVVLSSLAQLGLLQAESVVETPAEQPAQEAPVDPEQPQQ